MMDAGVVSAFRVGALAWLLELSAAGRCYVTEITIMCSVIGQALVREPTPVASAYVQASTRLFSVRVACSGHARLKC
jgi:hypothetical protein